MPVGAAPALWMAMCFVLITLWYFLIHKVFPNKPARFVNIAAIILLVIMVALVPLSYKILDLVS